VADTQSRGIATAPLPCAGHAIAVFLGIVVVVVVGGTVVVVVVVVVGGGGTVVVVVIGLVVVVTGTVVVVDVVVAGMVVVVVVVVVVGGGGVTEHDVGIVVVVVVARDGLSWAEVVMAVVMTTIALRTKVITEPRPSTWRERRVTQRMYNASRSTPWTHVLAESRPVLRSTENDPLSCSRDIREGSQSSKVSAALAMVAM
jgi:hypothetical protein